MFFILYLRKNERCVFMKNKFKNFISVLLVCVLLVMSMPMQSFAAFENLKVPVIQEIKLNESSQAVSLKEVDDHFTSVLETLEENDVELKNISDEQLSFYLSLLNYNLYLSAFEFELDVTLSTGKTYSVSVDEGEIEINRIYNIVTECYINYSTYLEAKENGADKIEINLCATPYNKLTNNYCYDTEYITTDEFPLVDMYIKSLTPLSGISEKVYADADYCEIDGAEFLIEYADGTTDTAKVFRDTPAYTNPYDSMENYTLKGIPLYACYFINYDDETEETTAEYMVAYLDAVYTQSVEVNEQSLIGNVKITNYVIDSKTTCLNSIEYEITYIDGNVKSFTKKFNQEENEMLHYGLNINAFDGYIVCVDISMDDGDMETMKNDNIYITVSVGEHYDSFIIENPNKDITNIALNIIVFIQNLIANIKDFLFNLFY